MNVDKKCRPKKCFSTFNKGSIMKIRMFAKITVGFTAVFSLVGCNGGSNPIASAAHVQALDKEATVAATATVAPVTITGISGYSDGVGVTNAQWLGQPSRAPSTASNQYKGFFVVESRNNSYFWDIKGTNFTNTPGSVWILDKNLNPIPGISISIVNWGNSVIRIIPKGYFNFTFYKGSYLAVTLDKQQPNACSPRVDEKLINIVGIIQSRGYGQCTYFVANQRLNAGLNIPSPSAYTVNGQISAAGDPDNGYVPQLYDCLNYSGLHVAIISSAPQKTIDKTGSITWKFTVSEMNATWNEATSSSTRTYVLSPPDSKGQRKVVSGIGTNASKSWYATARYR